MIKKDKNIFNAINKYLTKKGHELYFSIYLSNYNGNEIYIRFDYVSKLTVYKIVWVDLKFFDIKHIEDYINVQTVTKFLALAIVEKLKKKDVPNRYEYNEDIIGDRVEILTYYNNHEYIFDRFLPLDLEFLIDPLALVFSYLPRSMEVFLHEIFGKFDHLEDVYNYAKPVKFNLLKGDASKIFKPQIIERGQKYYEEGRVHFLEKIGNSYFAIVEGTESYVVIINQVDDSHIRFWCSCKYNTFCKHLYAVLLAIRNKKFNNFYKLKYVGKEQSILEKITSYNYYLCMGHDEEHLLIVTIDGVIFPVKTIKNNKCLFEVVEDDDDLSLSKYIKDMQQE